MTIDGAIKVLIAAKRMPSIYDGYLGQAIDMAIKSLEAWEKIKDQLSELVHHNLDVKENFEIGSTSRIECNTTASVLAGVIDLIDKHLSEVSK